MCVCVCGCGRGGDTPSASFLARQKRGGESRVGNQSDQGPGLVGGVGGLSSGGGCRTMRGGSLGRVPLRREGLGVMLNMVEGVLWTRRGVVRVGLPGLRGLGVGGEGDVERSMVSGGGEGRTGENQLKSRLGRSVV